MVVVACIGHSCGNNPLPERVPLPVLGVIEPGVRAAIAQTRNNKVGVIGTAGTINSSEHKTLLRERQTCRCLRKPAPCLSCCGKQPCGHPRGAAGSGRISSTA